MLGAGVWLWGVGSTARRVKGARFLVDTTSETQHPMTALQGKRPKGRAEEICSKG